MSPAGRKGVAADDPAKRRILDRLMNGRFVDGKLDMAIRKPFDVLAEGLLIPSSRGDMIRTCDFLLPKKSLPTATMATTLKFQAFPSSANHRIRIARMNCTAESHNLYRPRREACPSLPAGHSLRSESYDPSCSGFQDRTAGLATTEPAKCVSYSCNQKLVDQIIGG